MNGRKGFQLQKEKRATLLSGLSQHCQTFGVLTFCAKKDAGQFRDSSPQTFGEMPGVLPSGYKYEQDSPDFTKFKASHGKQTGYDKTA